MQHIASLLPNEQCVAKTQVNSKKKALELIAQTIANNLTDLKSDELFQSLIARERLGSTGIGEGIAIPHCRHKQIRKPTGVCITLEKPIEFDAVDNLPVDVLFAILVPEDADESHLQALASIADTLQQPTCLTRVRQANSNEALYTALAH